MSSKTEVPRLALTPGEPAGIGPDLCIAAAQQAHAAELIAVCDPRLLSERAEALGVELSLEPFDPARRARAATPGRLLVDAPARLQAPVQPGTLCRENADYVLQTLTAACSGCLTGRWDALVTGPVHKGIINDAGLAFSGHTEHLAQCCAQRAEPPPLPVMMLVAPGLRVALATTHLPLRAVADAITEPRLERVLRTLVAALQQDFGIAEPRVLVCGLNPHAGEGGHLGHEEQEVLIPLIERLRAEGMPLLGPLPADTAFVPRQLEHADAVLAMYHDQGLPVLKHLGFGRAVNVTLGLPIIRTSVDHGTALDLAASGRADTGSLLAAIELAAEMVKARTRAKR
jgi:4-hydroxythreonine-4-phosphate dehydrogenase